MTWADDVAFFSRTASFGGGETILAQVATSWGVDPGEPVVYVAEDGGQGLAEELWRRGVAPILLDATLLGERTWEGEVTLGLELARRLAVTRARLLYANGASAAPAALVAGAATRTPVVLHLHDPLPQLQTEFHHRTAQLAERFSPVLLISTTPEVQARAREVLPNASIQHALIPPGVRLDCCAPGDHSVRPTLPIVSSFARFDDYKGATDFVRAVAILRDRGTRVTAWLCGPSGTSDRTAAEVLALVDRLGLGPLVRLPGYVSAAERCHLLSMSVALVHPARRESFGLAIAEALAHGTPVVAAQSDGAALLLSEGGGRIVPAARPDAIACAIEALVRDPREHERLGREGRTAVARNWDITTMLERIRFVLRTALAGEGAVAES